MADLARQDRTSTRTFNALEQKYRFKTTQEQVSKTEKKIDNIEFDKESIEKNLSELNIKTSDLEDSKVDKVEGKGLSTNDFTDEEKNKIDNLEIDDELSNTSENPVQNKVLKLELDKKFNADDLIDYIYPVGTNIVNESSSFNPNTLYQNTTWNLDSSGEQNVWIRIN